MPSIVKNMEAATETLVTEKRNAKIKPSLIMVDNVLAGEDSELTFQDIFDTNASIVAATGVAAPAVEDQTVNRLRINVSDEACVSIRDELKDVKFLGGAQVARTVAGAPDANVNCHVTLGYDLE
ncbi:unnamed protein product [marine sediment metagenome]|uniref:Uncharacterized protein n=1 Tax=marine sediment metagenome TaxID=412755 RepID=X1J8K7_9ZZZZ